MWLGHDTYPSSSDDQLEEFLQYTDEDGFNYLIASALTTTDIFSSLYDDYSDSHHYDFFKSESSQQLLLYAAVESGNRCAMAAAIAHGASPNKPSGYNDITPMEHAKYNKDTLVMLDLLHSKALTVLADKLIHRYS